MLFKSFAGPLENPHSLDIVKLLEHHLNDLRLFRRYHLTYEVCLNGKLAMLFSPVDQYRKLNPLRPSEVHKLIHSGPDRATGVEYIVDQYDTPSFDVFGKFRSVDDGICSDCGKVVAIESNVDDPVERFRSLESLDLIAKPFGEGYAATPDADEIDILRSMIRLNDLGRQPRKGPLHAGFIHDPGFFYQVSFVCHSSANRSKPMANIKIRDLSF